MNLQTGIIVVIPILLGFLIGILRQRNAMSNYKFLSTWKILLAWWVVDNFRDKIFNFFDKVAQFISQLCGSYSVFFGDFIFVRLVLKGMYLMIPSLFIGYFMGRISYFLFHAYLIKK